MSESFAEERKFKSELFSTEPYSDEGEADGYPTLQEVSVDAELQHPNWKAEKAGRHLLGLLDKESIGAASYGYVVYHELLKEDEPVDAVYLDPRCFLPETNLLDVLNETAKTAIAYDDMHLVAPIVKGMVDTAQTHNVPVTKMRKYMPTVLGSYEIDAIRPFVDFMNVNTLKTREESKQILLQMAHEVQWLPVKEANQQDVGVDKLDKQLLLEDIGHAWIRKALPVAEIDWLP